MLTRRHAKPAGQFIAVDAKGRRYTINRFVDVFAKQSEGGTSEAEGVAFFATILGDPIEHLGKGRYRIVGLTRTNLYSDDPDAP